MRKIMAIWAIVSAIVLGGVAKAGDGTLPAFAKIKPTHSHLCLNSMDKRHDLGASIVQWSCSDQDTQRFSFTPSADGFYTIKSKGSSLCFGVPYAWQGKVGVTLYQVGCDLYDRRSNEFIVRDEGGGTYSISPARAPQTCLGVTYNSMDMFASVVQEACAHSANQRFEFIEE